MNATDLTSFLELRASERLKSAQSILRSAASELSTKLGVATIENGLDGGQALIQATFQKDPIATEQLLKALVKVELEALSQVAEAIQEQGKPKAAIAKDPQPPAPTPVPAPAGKPAAPKLEVVKPKKTK